MEVINKSSKDKSLRRISAVSKYFVKFADKFYKDTHKMYKLAYCVWDKEKLVCLVEGSDLNKFPCQFNVVVSGDYQLNTTVVPPRVGGTLNQKALGDLCNSVVAGYQVIDLLKKLDLTEITTIGWHDRDFFE